MLIVMNGMQINIFKINTAQWYVYVRLEDFKVVIHVEMPKAAPKKSIRHFQNLEIILK